MNDYYAVQRSTDHLAHYGVKGMKWGVRKAIEKGNSKALARHYKRANKKLAKLNDQADRDLQFKQAERLNKAAKTATKVGLVGLASIGVHGAAAEIYEQQGNKLFEKWLKETNGGKKSASSGLMAAMDKNSRHIASANRALGIGGAIGVGGLTTAAGLKASAINASRRTTTKGHAKAVAKRDAWKKEMNSAFKGTQYDASGSVKRKRKSK